MEQQTDGQPPTESPASTEPPPPPSPVPAAPPPKFCRDCGAAWQSEWATCAACAARAARPAPQPDTSRPVGSALALYFAWLGISTVTILWSMFGGSDEITVEFASTAASAILVLAWCVPARRELAPPLLRCPHLGWFALAAVGAACTYSVASGAVALLNRFVELVDLQYTDAFFDSGYGWGAAVLCICVQPAVIEELAFRGIIFGALRRVLEPMEAVLVSTLMFMILHLAVASFPHLFVIGLLLGWMRMHTGSMYPGMLLHFLHNFLVVLNERGLWPW